MSDVTFRLARLGEDRAIIDFINEHFDMRLPLLNRLNSFTTTMPGAAVYPSSPWPNRTAAM